MNGLAGLLIALGPFVAVWLLIVAYDEVRGESPFDDPRTHHHLPAVSAQPDGESE